MSLIRPFTMNNGVMVEMQGDVLDMLRFGYAPLGWEGDPRLTLAYNRVEDRIELWREEDDGEFRIVTRSRPGMRTVDMNLVKFLVDHDRQRGFDPQKAVDDHNEKILKHNYEKTQGAIDEAADRLHGALRKDIGL
jgi:hypothetical protein